MDVRKDLCEMLHWLVVESYPSEKYEFISWDDEIPNIWKNKTCSKPLRSRARQAPGVFIAFLHQSVSFQLF